MTPNNLSNVSGLSVRLPDSKPVPPLPNGKAPSKRPGK